MNHRIYEGLFILLVIAVFGLNLLALKHMHTMVNVYRVTAMLVSALLCYELATGGGEEHAFLWFYFFPLVAFYLVEKKEGLVWVGLSVGLSGFFFFAPFFHEYATEIGIRFLITYGIVSILSFGLESSRQRYYEELMREKRKLEHALAEVKTLQGLLPICAVCKRIRDDKGYWNQMEAYIHEHSEAEFSHGICPECAQKLYPEFHVTRK